MRRALDLASAHYPHPNPRVGAVLLSEAGEVVGEGAHAGPGHPHAEILAIQQAGALSQGATMVVTLEPCSHLGRTPPCIDAIAEAGISAVVIAASDPDKRVSGKGVAGLNARRINVIEGVLAGASEEIDPAYFHHRRRGRPLITYKTALTIDGQTAAADGSSRWLTGPLARADAHQLRSKADAIMVGAGTVLADNPRLDVRLPGYIGHQPRPVVVIGRRSLPQSAAIWDQNPVVVVAAPWSWPDDVVVANAELLTVEGDDRGLPNLAAAVSALAELGLLDVVVEGGPTLAAGLWDRNLIDRGVFYLAGLVAGGAGHPVFTGSWPTVSDGRPVEITSVLQLGPDLRVDFTAAEFVPGPSQRE
ncbi:MAG: bifunctional diaminohydroxyphosphoribosylaminopyrimidine deaminase/5-amino-6-(5-phosphoribosylamino)uracil reductase RibD [Actinomycetota bacterium]